MTDSARHRHSLRSNILFAFALGLACYLAWVLRNQLMLVYVAALFAVVLMPVVQAVQRVHVGAWRPNKGFAVFVMLVAIAAFLTGFGFLAVPPVTRDLQQ